MLQKYLILSTFWQLHSDNFSNFVILFCFVLFFMFFCFEWECTGGIQQANKPSFSILSVLHTHTFLINYVYTVWLSHVKWCSWLSPICLVTLDCMSNMEVIDTLHCQSWKLLTRGLHWWNVLRDLKISWIQVILKEVITRQQKRHRCIEQSYGLCGRGRGWEDLGEWHWNM